MDELDITQLVERCGRPYVAKRLQAQVDHAASILGPGLGSFHFENLETAMNVLGYLIKLFGAWNRGHANIKDQRTVFNSVVIPRLPEPFEGMKILHLSDLHLDVCEHMGAHIGALCSKLTFDLALITGDFRYHTHSDYYPMFKEVEELAVSLHCRYGCYGVLGNHDFLEFVPTLEKRGIRMLLNESTCLEERGERLWVIGLDDAHFYGVHNYEKGFSGIPDDDTKLLMIHSPETLIDAYHYGADFVLSGHTHGGQICLPTGTPIWMNAACERRYCIGAWDYRGMPGFTSAGAGSSGLPIRFNCPPQIVIHELTGVPRRDVDNVP